MLALDTETTGKDPHSAELVSVALVEYVPGSEDESIVHTWLVDAGCTIPAAATRIHGITTADVQIPADLLPELDALATTTGVTRSRIVANLVTHMVSRERPELATIDIAWPDQQGRLPLAI